MSAMATFEPASASAVAMPRPMPEAAPVTMAVLPEMSIREGPFGSSMEVAAGIYGDRLSGHRGGAAHRDHHVGAVVLVGGLFQQRLGCGALDKFGPEIGCRSRTLQQARRHAVAERLRRQGHRPAPRHV